MTVKIPASPLAILACSVPNYLHSKVPLAACRAGYCGVLDLEFADLGEPDVMQAVTAFRDAAPSLWSLKLAGRALSTLLSSGLIGAQGPHTVLLAGDLASMSQADIDALRKAAPGVRVLAEVISEGCLQAAEALKPDALVAKGHEAGGRSGDETSFILLQRLVQKTALPIIAHGGVGPDTAAAFRVGGAEGVVLDWQLALFEAAQTPEPMAKAIRNVDGSESYHIPAVGREGYRVFWRADHTPAHDLKILAEQHPGELAEAVLARVDPATGQGPWLTGQDAGFARSMAERFGRLGPALDAVNRNASHLINEAQRLKPLNRGAALAKSLGTEFPIIQGPMTRVSDRAAFARAVADAGALPFLALALMRDQEAADLVSETRDLLQDRPWGVGILGFVDDELREEQLKVILDHMPDYALIAGGRPEQALSLEKSGIPTFLHVPSPGLLMAFLQQGARRFIFEGRECGGHVGPRSSAVLWQQALDTLHTFYGDKPMDCQILFAGGIHDARSAAMVSALSSDIAEHGAEIGALVGSAYILTHEAIDAKAIVPQYQNIVANADQTVLLESGVGHATRVVKSPIANEFQQEKARLISEGLGNEAVRERLERMNVGRSRVASKGIDRNPDFGQMEGARKYVEVSDEDQRKKGVYMIGQVAGLKSAPFSIADLHQEISDGSGALLDEMATRSEAGVAFPEGPGARIALTGMSTILPKAPDLESFWQNILDKVDAITEIPERRWDWRRIFDQDKNTADKTYSRWGGFVDELEFDPLYYGIPPNSMTSVEPLQLLALEVVRKALENAGFKDGKIPDPDLRRRTSVIIGVGGGAAPLGQQYAVRASLPALMGEVPDQVKNRLPEWTEDSFPGILLNVIAGRVANRFDLGGVNFTVDAACGSSLAAVMTGMRELESGNSDMVIVAGADAFMSPFDFIAFAKTHALSERGRCRTFDASADGIAISEGIVAMVLRPLAAAEAAGDRIYAIVRGVAGASDGRDLSLTAPRPEGQQEALRRAYDRAGISPASVGLIEAHGTGTVVGDRTEIQSLSAVFNSACDDKQFCGVGSVKSMIGHTKAAAGCAGMAKIALALHHRVLPPTLNVDEPNPSANFSESPFYPVTETRPWLRTGSDPRRAGVSAFGFGGTNFHAVLEEYEGGYLAQHQEPFRRSWNHELLLFSADDQNRLAADLRRAGDAFEAADFTLCNVAASLADKFDPDAGARFAMVTTSFDDAASRLRVAADQLATGSKDLRAVDPMGAYFSSEAPLTRDQIGFLFPGQGSQYPNMAAGLTMHFPKMRKTLEQANAVLRTSLPVPLTDLIYPRPVFSDDERTDQAKHLMQTNVAQPAIGAVSAGIHALLRGFGAEAGALAGHSFGELSALSASGAFDAVDLWTLAHARGDAIIREGGSDLGTMAAVLASEERIREVVGDPDGVTFANFNAPNQTVLAGSADALEVVEEALGVADISVRRLPVACAFHSEFVAPARELLAKAIAETDINAPGIPVYANESGAPYPEDSKAVGEMLARHLTQPVNFLGSIRAMHDAGVRLFVEVGPNAVLSRLTERILSDKQHLSVATDVEGRSGVQQFLAALGAMSAAGVGLDLTSLWSGRADDTVDVVDWAPKTVDDGSQAFKWMVDPGRVRPLGGAVDKLGLAGRIENDPVLAPNTPLPPAGATPPSPHSLPSNSPIPHPAIGHSSGATVEVMRQHHELISRLIDSHAQTMQLLLGDGAAVQEHIAAPSQQSSQGSAQAPAVAAQIQPAPVPEPTPEKSEPVVGATPDRPDPQAVAQKLLELISERTGYPPEMLGSDLNLEADLGIDSIKRVEILANLRLTFLAEAGEAAHERMGPVARERTVDGIVTQFMQVVDAVCSPSANLAPVAENTSASIARPDPQAVAQKLLELISERTGYPPEMLGSDLNLEADLGIDSIKRVEILANLRLTFLAEAGEAAHERMGPVARERTVDGIVARFMQVVDAVSDDRPSAVDSKPIGENKAEPKKIRDRATRRFVMEPSVAEPCDAAEWVVPGAIYLITDDTCGTASRLSDMIIAAGAEALVLDPGTLTPEGLQERIAGQQEKVAGVIHCASLFSPEDGSKSIDMFMDQASRALESLFIVLSAVGSHLSERDDAVIVAASRMGGAFGFDDSTSLVPASAGAAALLKTLAKEWTLAHVRSLDLEASADPVSAAELIFEEAGRKDGIVEIGRENGTRLRLVAKPRPVAVIEEVIEQDVLNKDSVVLVTGGARGITARCVLRLAEKYRPQFVIAGSSPAPTAEEAPETAVIAEPAAIRAFLAKNAQAEGRKLTIAEIEGQASAILKAREIRETLKEIKATGARVEYHSCDVCDREQVSALAERLYNNHGRIDGVIHGAGIIEDHLLVDKTIDSFRRVVSTKAESAYHLAHALRSEEVKFLVFFTSVAGRFGNRGQGDYGAANEIVSKYARQLDQAWPGRVVAISWGPWDSGGMVSEEVKAQFSALGIEAVDPDLGIRALESEILATQDCVPEIVWGLGPWAYDVPAEVAAQESVEAAE